MKTFVCAAVLAFLAAGAVQAGEAPSAATGQAVSSSDTARSPRLVYVCDADAATRRAFIREFGSAGFVSAEQAQARGEAWTAPRCVTSAEARRLKQLASAR